MVIFLQFLVSFSHHANPALVDELLVTLPVHDLAIEGLLDELGDGRIERLAMCSYPAFSFVVRPPLVIMI
jgi:hypothetical protein